MITLPCSKPELFNYSPHQGRMLLLDQVVQYDLKEHSLQSKLLIDRDSEFYSSDFACVPVWISFEYMAQSIAVLSGISHKEEGNDPKIGFIMGVRDFNSFSDGFIPGNELTVSVSQSFRDGDVAVFDGVVMINEKICSTAVINVIENNQKLLERWKSEK